MTTLTLSQADIEAIADAVVRKQKLARLAELVRPDTLSCAEFAERVGRSAEWVQDRCRTRQIKTVAGRRPYRIPAEELQRMLEGGRR